MHLSVCKEGLALPHSFLGLRDSREQRCEAVVGIMKLGQEREMECRALDETGLKELKKKNPHRGIYFWF